MDVETGRVDHFEPPPESDSGNRAIVIYSGIHYDATSITPMLDAPEDFHQTIVRKGQGEGADAEDEMLLAAKKLADSLRAKRAYTNTTTFDLKCQVRVRFAAFAYSPSGVADSQRCPLQICGQGLKGEKEARAHASQTGHVEFGEY